MAVNSYRKILIYILCLYLFIFAKFEINYSKIYEYKQNHIALNLLLTAQIGLLTAQIGLLTAQIGLLTAQIGLLTARIGLLTANKFALKAQITAELDC